MSVLSLWGLEGGTNGCGSTCGLTCLAIHYGLMALYMFQQIEGDIRETCCLGGSAAIGTALRCAIPVQELSQGSNASLFRVPVLYKMYCHVEQR